MEQKKSKQNSNNSAVPIALVFFTTLGVSVFFEKTSKYTLLVYAALSLITFIVYAKDKSAARKGRWRTPEQTLHFLSLTGGWPGALFAHKVLRHKSQKRSFRIVFWITVTVNLSALIWLHTVQGEKVYENVLTLVKKVKGSGK